ncbi:nudix hydrolase 8-like isoform X2 [Nymphaea colorata]|uniref:nudix hydrolase 8-like isoform X2 n=1 Tax=Nymphaea colorata TaxID=210225 RepID=UPI00129E373C|nr:nudix hydrolase 8-like isoform X2 [Nymphaea colorata]
MEIMMGRNLSTPYFQNGVLEQRLSWCKNYSPHMVGTQSGLRFKPGQLAVSSTRKKYLPIALKTGILSDNAYERRRTNAISIDTAVKETVELLESYDDEYGGAIIDPKSLPSCTNSFASILRSSLSYWESKGKRGIWLKILAEQSDLIPVAVKEGFKYHHAEPGYVMLTYWIPDEPCVLPANASHQVGVGGFVMNENREILVVQEKQCNLACSGVWKLPTGVIHKSEEIFAGAIREVKEETGIDTDFLEVIAFRHAHCVAFEKSDLFFICMLKPLSTQITIDELEIQASKWMPIDEFLEQPFYKEDHMSRKVYELCIASLENRYKGLTAHLLPSKFDGTSTYLYFSTAANNDGEIQV